MARIVYLTFFFCVQGKDDAMVDLKGLRFGPINQHARVNSSQRKPRLRQSAQQLLRQSTARSPARLSLEAKPRCSDCWQTAPDVSIPRFPALPEGWSSSVGHQGGGDVFRGLSGCVYYCSEHVHTLGRHQVDGGRVRRAPSVGGAHAGV